MRKAGSLPCLKSLILLVEQRGIEPLTSALRTRRSAKLSYCPTRNKILHFKFATKAYFATDLQRISGDFAKLRCSLSVGCCGGQIIVSIIDAHRFIARVIVELGRALRRFG